MNNNRFSLKITAVSYTHLRAHETVLDLVCRLLLEKKNTKHPTPYNDIVLLHKLYLRLTTLYQEQIRDITKHST